MSTTQSLQSCLEPLLMEPRDLMHQFRPPKSLLPISFEKEKEKEKENSLSKPNKTSAAQEPSYVHPLSAKTSLNLSLEMCTESLGTETGSGIDEFSLLASAVEEEEEEEEELQSRRENLQQAKRQQAMKKAKHGGRNLNFPPPLSSISDGGVQVQTHREGGRLVMKAFSFSSSGRLFQAERGEGRLRLSLLKQDGSGDEEENVKEEGGRIWSSSSRCNGESSSNSNSKRMQSLPFCVVGV